MKNFTFILTVYILLLAAIPCADTNAQNIQVLQSQQLEMPCANESENHTDICTPFCSCECCHTTVQTVEIMNIPSPLVRLEKISLWGYSQVQDYYTSFFIPPKA